jgi:hypothetical protein
VLGIVVANEKESSFLGYKESQQEVKGVNAKAKDCSKSTG